MRKSILHAVWMFCLTFTAFAQSGLVYETRTVKSDILKMERKYAIYLPPGYAGSDQFYRDEQGRIYQFITNNREISNEEVALIYRLRRTIKLVFKKLKQNFQLHFFYSESENGIKTQVWVTLIAHLLLTALKRKTKSEKAFSTVAALLRIHFIT